MDKLTVFYRSLARELDSWAMTIWKKTLARTTEEGSRTLVHAGSQGADSHLKYLSNCRAMPTGGLAAGAESKKLQERVWKELSQKLEKIERGCTQNFSMS